MIFPWCWAQRGAADGRWHHQGLTKRIPIPPPGSGPRLPPAGLYFLPVTRQEVGLRGSGVGRGLSLASDLLHLLLGGRDSSWQSHGPPLRPPTPPQCEELRCPSCRSHAGVSGGSHVVCRSEPWPFSLVSRPLSPSLYLFYSSEVHVSWDF